MEKGPWVQARLDALVDATLGAAWLALLGVVLTSGVWLVTKLWAIPLPPAWAFALSGAFGAFVFMALGTAIIAGTKRARKSAKTLTTAIGVPHGPLEGVALERELLAERLVKRDDELRSRILALQECEKRFSDLTHRFTLNRFERFCERFPGVQVTIRSAGYTHDWPLVEQIKGLLERHAQWTVTLDPNNQPPLLPSSSFKVLVDWDSGAIDGLCSFLSSDDGRLLGHKVGMRRGSHAGLVISVLPSVPEE